MAEAFTPLDEPMAHPDGFRAGDGPRGGTKFVPMVPAVRGEPVRAVPVPVAPDELTR